MNRMIKRRPSPAMVVALLALVLACSGSATAAVVMTGEDVRGGKVALTGQAYVDNTPAPMTSVETRVLQVTVEPGAYVAQAHLEAHPGNGAAQGYCQLRAPLGSTPALLGATGSLFLGDDVLNGNIDSRFIGLGGGFQTDQGGAVELACRATDGAIESVDGDLVVTKVRELVAS